MEPDTAPGPYYVTALDRVSNDGANDRHFVVAGPFATHAEALALVDRAADVSRELDSRARFYAYGTARCQPTFTEAGPLNALLGVQPTFPPPPATQGPGCRR